MSGERRYFALLVDRATSGVRVFGPSCETAAEADAWAEREAERRAMRRPRWTVSPVGRADSPPVP